MLVEGVVKFSEEAGDVWGIETAEGFRECGDFLAGLDDMLTAQGKPETTAGMKIQIILGDE